jgi:hypothetical protein
MQGKGKTEEKWKLQKNWMKQKNCFQQKPPTLQADKESKSDKWQAKNIRKETLLTWLVNTQGPSARFKQASNN